MKKYSLGALVAAGLLVGGLSAGSASAADLGGNCCADLEERIAELEATTVRKGNRKVSLTISGWVAEQVMYWDDGFEQNEPVVPVHNLLSDPTGDREGYLAVALTDRRGLELSDALLEISAAVAPEIGGGRAASGKPANQQACCHQGTKTVPVSYTHLRAHETDSYLVCRLL